MNEIWQVAERGLALVIMFLFFGLLYSKLRHRTVGETWDDIKSWVGADKK